MEPSGMNYWAVLVAAVAYMALGAVWYSGALFGRTWMTAIGKSREQLAADFSLTSYFWAFVASFLSSYGIARIMSWTGGDSIVDGVRLAVLIGVSFVVATFGVNDLFERRPCKLTVINGLYHLVGFVIAGVIIGAWRP